MQRQARRSSRLGPGQLTTNTRTSAPPGESKRFMWDPLARADRLRRNVHPPEPPVHASGCCDGVALRDCGPDDPSKTKEDDACDAWDAELPAFRAAERDKAKAQISCPLARFSVTGARGRFQSSAHADERQGARAHAHDD